MGVLLWIALNIVNFTLNEEYERNSKRNSNDLGSFLSFWDKILDDELGRKKELIFGKQHGKIE